MAKKVGKKFNKADLVNKLAEENKITKVDANEQLDNCLESLVSLVSGMKPGDKLTLVGYGSVEVARREERKGRNPRTKEPMTIPAKTVVKMKAGKAFQEAVE